MRRPTLVRLREPKAKCFTRGWAGAELPGGGAAECAPWRQRLMSRPAAAAGGAGGCGALMRFEAGPWGRSLRTAESERRRGLGWLCRAAPAMSSPLAYQGYVYTFRSAMAQSQLASMQRTARNLKQRIPTAKIFWASSWSSDGRIYCLRGRQRTHILGCRTGGQVPGAHTIAEMFWPRCLPADTRLPSQR